MLSISYWLIVEPKFSSYGSRIDGLNLPRIVKGKGSQQPPLKKGEVCIRCELRLPESLFRKPTLSAAISIPEAAAGQQQISAEVVNNIQELVANQLGIQLTISAEVPDDA